MNDRWNLDPIYKGFEDPAFAQDMQSLEQTVKELSALAESLEGEPVSLLKRSLHLQETLANLAEKLFLYAELRQSADTSDAEAGSQMGKIMSIFSESAAPNAAIESWTASLPDLDALIDRDEYLGGYRFLLQQRRKSSSHNLPGIGERVMAKLKISGSSAWAELQQYLTSTVKANFRGEEIGLSAVRNLAYSADASVRKDAYEAELR